MQNYELMLENAPDAHILVSPTGEIMYVNLQTERLFGYNRSELVGQQLECLIPQRSRGVHLTHRSNYMKQPRLRMMGLKIPSLAGLRKDGTEFPAEVSLSPLGEGEVLAGVRERRPPEQHAQLVKRALAKFVLPTLVIHSTILAYVLYLLLFKRGFDGLP